MSNLSSSFFRGRWRLEPRQGTNRLWQVLSVVLAFLAALLISTILILVAKVNVGIAFSALFLGAFGSWRAVLETLTRAIPLILTGLCAAVAFRAKVWNIGGESQLIGGAMMGFWAYTLFSNLPGPLFFLLVLLFAFIGGAVLGGFSGWLKVRFRVDEIISTVMMNYIAAYFLSFMLSGGGPWMEKGSYYQQSALITPADRFPMLVPGSEVHMGFLVACLAAILIKILLDRTPLGYDIRALGFNPIAARFKGINISLTVIIVMALSGGLAGLAGGGELYGVHDRLVLGITNGYGYTGIIVAMLGGLDPIGVVVAAILFGGLINGAVGLQTATSIPTAFIDAIQAIVLLLVLIAFIVSRYQIKRIEDVEPDPAGRDHS